MRCGRSKQTRQQADGKRADKKETVHERARSPRPPIWDRRQAFAQVQQSTMND
jgi:hypothetical protein